MRVFARPVLGFAAMLLTAASLSAQAGPGSEQASPGSEQASPGSKIVFESPKDGAYVAQARITVRVRAAGAILGLSVNGVSGSRDRDGVFVVSPVSLPEGPATLTAVGTDRSGRTSRVSIAVVADRTPPRLTVLRAGAPLASGTIAPHTRVVFEADDRSPVEVTATLNGAPFSSGAELATPGSYTLRVEAADRAGNVARRSFSLRVAGATPPISNLRPASGAVVAGPSLAVSGDSPEAAEVTIGDVPALVYGGRFVATGVPLAAGRNRLPISVRDTAGNVSKQVLEIDRDDAPPTLAVAAPAAGSLTREGTVTVRGSAADPHLASVQVNGAVARNAGGRFDVSVPLVEGPNRLRVVALDAAGNRTESSVDVTRDSFAPEISISWPGPGSILASPAVDVSGEASDANLARVLVNGAPATLVGDRWSAKAVPLVPGLNTIRVEAVDRAGNSSKATVALTRDDAGLPVGISLPRALRSGVDELVGSVTSETGGPAPEGLSVTVDGKAAELSGGHFRARGLALREGRRSVTVRVSDSRGRAALGVGLLMVGGTAPEILSSEPRDGSRDVPATVVPRIVFSKPVDPSTITAASVRLVGGAGYPVPATLSVDGRIVSVLPATPLPARAPWRLEVSERLADTSGRSLPGARSIAFTTSGPVSAPDLDPMPASVCSTALTLAGRTEPGYRVQVSGGSSAAGAVAGADGRFSVAVPLPSESMSVLSVTASLPGSPVSPATVRAVRSDCAPPRVERADLDARTGALEIVFSEPVDAASLSAAGAVVVSRSSSEILRTPVLRLDATGRIARSEPSAALAGGAVVTVAPHVTDVAGNRMRTAHVVSTLATSVAQGGLSGQVFDDRIGRPLPGATVTVVAVDGAAPTPPAPTTTSGTDGSFGFVVPAGSVAIRTGMSGFVASTRIATVAANDSASAFDVRLTPETIVQAAANGSASAADQEVTLTIPAGGVAASSTVRVASVSPQGLPLLLPLGWAPAAAVSLELGAATPDPVASTTLPSSATAVWTNRFSYPAGTPMVLARYDAATRRWLGAGTATLAANASTITASIAQTGVYAVLVADPAPYAPPAATVGQPLGGVSAPVTDPVLSAALTTTPSDVLPTQTADIVSTLTLSAPVPSGFPVEVLVAETLTLVNQQQVQVPSFLEDLIVLRDGTGKFIVPFKVRPSSTAAQVALSVGYENLSVKRYGFDLPRGNLVGSAGGTVTGPSGFSLVVPAAALTATVPVGMTAIASAAGVPIPIPAGYSFLAAVQLTLGGQTLTAPASLRWANATDPTGGSAIWIEISTINGTQRARFVGPARWDNVNKWVETTPANVHNLFVPGVLDANIYVLLKSTAPLAYVKGRVLDVGGTAPVAAALVTEDGTSIVAVTDGLGQYSLPVPATGATVRSVRIDTGNPGSVAVPSQTAGATATKDVVLTVSAPYVLSVAPLTASQLPLDLPVVFTLSEPLNPATVASSSVTAASGATPISGTTRLSASGTQITFTPTLPWPGKSTVTLTLSSTVTDLQGYRLVDGVTKSVANYLATWTTVDPTPPTDVNPLLISMTSPAGTPPTVQITGAPGAACGTCTVIAVNDTTTATATTVASGTGSFSLTLAASLTDRVYIIIRRSSGAEIRVDPGPYSEDGGRTAHLSTRAADYITRDGIRVTVDDGSFSGATTLQVQPILPSDLPAPMPTLSTFVAAIHFDPGSAVSSRPIDLAVAAPSGVTGGQFLVARAVNVRGVTKWMIVDVARYDSGSITTRPPAGQTTFGKDLAGEIGLLSTSAVDCPELAGVTKAKSILDRVTRASDLLILGMQQQIGFVATTIPTPGPALSVSLTFASQYFYLLDFLPYVWVSGEAKQQCYFAMPVPIGIPFGILGQDATTGLTVFQGNFSAVTDPTNLTQAPSSGLTAIVPAPRLTAASPFTAATFVPITTVAPAERALLPKITYTFVSGTVTVKGTAGAVEASADLSVVNNLRAGSATGTAAADGSFSLALAGLVAGDDVTFLAGVKSLAPNATVHLTFSQPMDQPSMLTANFTPGPIAYDLASDSGTRGWTLTPRSSFPQGTVITFAIPATRIPKALSVKLSSSATVLLGPRAVKDVNALYLKGGLLVEITGNGGNVGDTGSAAKLNLYDATNPAALVLCGTSPALNDFARGVTMDGHDRVLVALGGGGTNGRVQVFRLGPIVPPGTAPCGGRALLPDGTGATDFDRSFTETTIVTGGGSLGVLPEGFPRRLEMVYRETRQTYVVDRDTTLPQFVTAITKTDVSPADGKQDANATLTVTGSIPGSGVAPSPLNQPATLIDRTTGASWTSYANASGAFTITAKASSGDRLEFRINAAEVAIVGTLGFGIQGVDVNKTVHLYGQDCIPGGSANDLCPAASRLLFSFGRVSDLTPSLCFAYDSTGACLNAINRLDQLVDLAVLPDPVPPAPGALPAPADPATDTVYGLVNRFGLATFALTGTGETVRLAQLGSGIPVGTFDNPPIQPNFFAMSVVRGFPVRPAGHRQFCTDPLWKLATGDRYLPTLAFIASSEGVFVVDVTKASVGGTSLYPEPSVIGLFRMATGSATTVSVDASRGYVYVGSDGSPGKINVFDMTDPCTLGLTGRVAPATDPRLLTSVAMSGYNPNAAMTVDADTGMLFGAGDSTTGGNGQAFALNLFGPPLRFVADTDRDGQWEQVGSGIPLGVDNPKKPAAPYAPDVVRVSAGIFGAAGTEIVAEVSSTSAAGIILSDLPSNFPRTKTYVVLTRQSNDPADPGYNRYLSPPIVLVADPRAEHAYTRATAEDDQSNDEACRNCKTDAGYAAELAVWAPATDGVTRATPARGAVEQWAGDQLVVRLAEDAAAETTLKGKAPYLNGLDLKRSVTAIPLTRGDLAPALLQTPPQNASLVTTEAGVAVDTHSGSAQTAWTDLSFKGRAGLDFALTRYYVSDVLHFGPFGRNMDSPLFARLRSLPNGNVDFYPGDGTRQTFHYKPGATPPQGYFEAPPGVFLDLYHPSDLTFTLVYPDKTEMIFDANGRLTSLVDRQTTAADGTDGNQLNFSYDGNGRLVLVTDPTKREVRFEYNLDTAAVGSRGRISKVTDFDNRVVTYTYDASGRLTDTDGPDPLSASSRKPHTKLAWTAVPATPLKTSLYRAGEVLSDTDGESRKVFDVAYLASTPAATDNVKLGGGTWQMAYAGATTTVTDPNANATTYTHTADGQPASVARPGGATTSFSYDSELRLLVGTKPLGDSVAYSYPASGGPSKLALGNVLSSSDNPKPGTPEATAGLSLTTTMTYQASTNLPVSVKAPDGSTTTVDRDAKGNPTTVHLPDGTTRQFGFDSRGRLTTSTDGLGVTETYAYFDNTAGVKEGYLKSRTTNGISTTNYQVDNRGNVTTVTDPLAHASTYTVNAIDQVEAEARGASSSKSTFNAVGQVITRDVLTGTDASSNPIYAHIAYNVDSVGRLNSRTETATVGSAIATYTYDLAGNVKTIARTDSPTTTFNYDTRNRVQTVTTGTGTTTYNYDDDDARTSVKNARNFTTTYLLDGFGRNIGAIDPTNVKTKEFLDLAGRSLESRTTLVSGPNETLYRWSTRQYDPAGRVTREIRKLFTAPIAVNADGSIPTAGVSDVIVDTTYDANGNVLTVKDPLLRVSRNDYDTRGRLLKVTDPIGHNVVYAYDDANNKTTETVTELLPTTGSQTFLTKYFYDAQNRLTKVTDPLNQDTLYQYDPRGNRTQTTDVELHISTALYDLLGRKTSETDANAGTTLYAYDLSGHLTSITDANNNQTIFTYDGNGRLQTEKRADLKTWTYGYDANGNRTSVTDPNGTVVTTAYDADDRATGRTITRGTGVLGPTGVTFGLDAIGRITSSSTAGDTAAAVEAFTYDSLDRLLTEQQKVGTGANRTVTKGYDAASNLTALTYPSTLALTYTVDALNRIASIKQGATTIVSYRDVGARPFDRTLVNGIVQTWGYDAGRRLNDVLSKNGATTVSDIAYTLSPLGNKTAISRPDLGKKATYAFNPNSWITQEALNLPIAGGTPERQTDYTADKVLNYTQIQERVNGAITATKTQTTNNRNQYPTFNAQALTYDPNGNLTGGAGLSGTALAYDFENRLKKATLSSGTVIENLFDAQGRKVRESTTVSGVTKTVDYVLHGDQVLEQYAGATLSARYVKGRGIDETVRAELDVDANGTLETTVYPLQDELGNVERLTDAAGANLERYDYQGYGKPRIFDPTGTLRASSSYGWKWLFQGREYQTTLLAYDFRARELWPDLGRFGQEDPAGFVPSPNLQQALEANTIGHVDPLGERGGIPNWGDESGTIHHNYHAVKLRLRPSAPKGFDLSATRRQIYKELEDFTWFNRPNQNVARLKPDGALLHFYMRSGDLWSTLTALGSALNLNDIVVRLVPKPTEYEITAVTVDDHPLVGVRKWRVVTTEDPRVLVVETEAYEQGAALINNLAHPISKVFQDDMWVTYMQNIAAAYATTFMAAFPPTRLENSPDKENRYRKTLPPDLQNDLPWYQRRYIGPL